MLKQRERKVEIKDKNLKQIKIKTFKKLTSRIVSLVIKICL